MQIYCCLKYFSYLCPNQNIPIMKRICLLLMAVLMAAGSLYARVDRYKTDVDVDKTINHITYELPFYYDKDRTNLVGFYTLATNISGKKSGTLSFDFRETQNLFSQNIRKAILRLAKDLRESRDIYVSMAFTLASGEVFSFDASFFEDWSMAEWNQLIHVTYDRETNEYRSYIMFPLEFLITNGPKIQKTSAARYAYVLKALSKSNIVQITVQSRSNQAQINLNIPIDRPTAETMNHMINKKISPSKNNSKDKDKGKGSKKKSKKGISLFGRR